MSSRCFVPRVAGAVSLPVAAAFVLLFTAQPAAANDGAFYGAGATVYPTNDDAVAMETEDLVIRQMGPAVGSFVDEWQVEVLYTFRNTTDRKVTVQMGFPEKCQSEPGDEFEEGECPKPAIRDFTVEIDGRRVRSKVRKAPKERMAPLENLYYQRVHTFDVTFAPGQSRQVRHTYHHGSSVVAPFTSELEYILQTGSMWAGTIRKLNITVAAWDRFASVQLPKELPAPTVGEQDGYRTWSWELSDYEPKHDLLVSFSEPNGMARSQAIESVCGMEQKALDAMSKAELGLLRNTVYAAYGYTFKKDKYRDHFGAVEWYRPRADYDASWVTADHQRCVRRLKGLEKAK